MKPTTWIFPAGIIWATLVAACAVSPDESRLDKSRKVVSAFGASLKQELGIGLAGGGPTAAVDICRDRAPQIASDLSRLSGAKVRRTSSRFRNPGNAPEPWETEVLKQFATRSAAVPSDEPMEYFTVDSDGVARYMSVIRVDGVCLACHGTSLSEALRDQLDEVYPHDRARGYALGEIRGAFSVTWPVE